MEPENRPEPPNLPAVPPGPRDRSAGPTPGAGYPPPGPPPSDPWATGRRRGSGGSWASSSWLRRLRPRSARLAVGLGLVGAAILLFPFAAAQTQQGQYAWWLPLGLGVGSLALITLLRLDRVLFGWAPHVAGVVLVGTLVWQTSSNPWAWGLAVGIGTAVAGLLLLPRWMVLAVGAAILVVSGLGYSLRSGEQAAAAGAQWQQEHDINKGQLGAPSATEVLPLLLNNVALNNPAPICENLLTGQAVASFATANGVPDCTSAVARLSGEVRDRNRYYRGKAPTADSGPDTVIDGCSMKWDAGSELGPQIGHLTAERVGSTYVIVNFQPC